jgi:tetratricopeptide (TPR) repeat protein
MRNLIAILIALFLLLPVVGNAEFREIISEGNYNMGDGETPSVAESRAVLDAKRIALEEAGTYVESYSKVKNFQLTEDEVKVLASGTIDVTVLDKKRTIVGDGFHFWVKIKAKVNSDKLTEMARNVKEKSVVEDYKKIQREYEKNQKEIEVLKKELALAKGEAARKRVETRIAGEEKLFQANEWFEKGLRHTVGNEEDLAIEEYTRAIALNPDYAEAYNNRGIAYYNRGLATNDQGQFEQAAKDFRKVIDLKPGSYAAHFAQATIYIFAEQYDQALMELNKAIALDPDEGVAYVGRGFIYTREKKKDLARATEDFSRVIAKGGPWSPMAYLNRALIFMDNKRFDAAIADFNKAIEMSPRNARAYLGRGIALAYQRQFSMAIADLNRAIDLDPKAPNAYNIRGMIYTQIGNPRAIADFQKACDMGFEEGCSNWQRMLRNR